MKERLTFDGDFKIDDFSIKSSDIKYFNQVINSPMGIGYYVSFWLVIASLFMCICIPKFANIALGFCVVLVPSIHFISIYKEIKTSSD